MPEKLLDEWFKILILLVATGSVAIASSMTGAPATPAAAEIEMAGRFDLTPAFHMSYPEGWTFQSGGVGIILFAETRTVFAYPPKAGPSLTVFRTDPYTLDSTDLAEAFETYLRRGPLRGDKFRIINEVSETTIDGREALEATVEGRQFSSSELMRAHIIMTKADEEEHFYILSADAPVDRWEETWPVMQAMLETADIRE